MGSGKKVTQHGGLLSLVAHHSRLCDLLRRARHGDLHLGRIAEYVAGELLYLGWHRG